MTRPARTLLMLLAASHALGAQVPQREAPQGGEASEPRSVRRLVDCVEAPYAYLRLDGEGADASAVQQLLADPALDVLFDSAGGRPAASDTAASDTAGGDASGGDAAGGEAGSPPGSSPHSSSPHSSSPHSSSPHSSSQALKLVRGMLARGVGEFELVLTGVVGAEGSPLLLLRCRLEHDTARRWRDRLEQGADLARPSRQLGGEQTYQLVDSGLSSTRAGATFELAVVGDDLVIGNDTSAMREVLEPQPPRTATNATRKVLSADPRFRELRDRMDLPSGSLLAYGDWQRLGARLQSSLTGAGGQLLASSGLGTAQSVMIALSPAGKAGRAKDGGFEATMLLDFGPRGAGSPDIDGWFAATKPVAARGLLRELPRGGLGGLVLSVDLAAVAAASPRSSYLVWDVREAFDEFGLDFDRNVLDRLGSRGTVQLHFGPVDGAPVAAVTPVYSVRAKNRKAAVDLFGDLHRVVEKTALGEIVEARDSRGKRVEVLKLQGSAHDFTAFVVLHDDTLLVTGDQGSLVQVHEELRRNKPRANGLAASTIQSIGGADVAGLFDVDLDPVFRHVAAAFAGVDLSALPKRHVGYVDVDRRDLDSSGGRAVVRVRLLSSL